AGAYALRDILSLEGNEKKAVFEEVPEKQVSEGTIRDSNVAAVQRSSDHYSDLYDKYAAGALANDPVSIEKYMMLSGACESGIQVMPGGRVPEEVKRLREFCAMHSSNKEEAAYQMDNLWPQSYSAKLQDRLRELEMRDGKDAVSREL